MFSLLKTISLSLFCINFTIVSLRFILSTEIGRFIYHEKSTVSHLSRSSIHRPRYALSLRDSYWRDPTSTGNIPEPSTHNLTCICFLSVSALTAQSATFDPTLCLWNKGSKVFSTIRKLHQLVKERKTNAVSRVFFENLPGSSVPTSPNLRLPLKAIYRYASDFLHARG